MNPFLALTVTLSVASSGVFVLPYNSPSAWAAPVPPAGKRAATHRPPPRAVAPHLDAVAMAEAQPSSCADDPACEDRARRLAEALVCAEKGGMLSDGDCLVSSPPSAEPPSPRPKAAASLSSALSSFLVGPVPVKVVGALLSQPAVQDRLWRAACGLVRQCADGQAKAAKEETPEQDEPEE